MPRLPDFLIIGAMKAGTTTLYYDLLANPGIFFPVDKEVNCLLENDATSREGIGRYAAHFRTAQKHQLCGDASTAYAKRPEWQGAVECAAKILPPHLKIIYMVREPVSRIMSHYRHDIAARRITMGIDQAIREHSPLIDFTRYSWQIEPWIERFGPTQVRIVPFTEYVSDRHAVVRSLCTFLGVKHHPDTIDASQAYNISRSKPDAKGPFYAMSRNPAYRSYLRPFLSQSFREVLRSAMLPKATTTTQRPSAATLRIIREELVKDHEALRKLMNRDKPLWSFKVEPELNPRAG